MFGLDVRALRVAWTVFLLAASLWLLYLLRGVLFVFILAILFAYVVWPLVAVMETWFGKLVPPGRPARLSALAVVYPVLIGLAILAGVVIAPQIAQQGTMLVEKVTSFAARIQHGGLLEQLSQKRGWSLPALYALRDEVLRHTVFLVPYLQSALGELLRYLSVLWLVVLVPILAFFLLKDAERLVADVRGWLGAQQYRDFLQEIFTDLHDLLAQYMRALILL